MVIDFFASLSFYFIPYLTGRFFTKNFFYAYMLGALIWFILFFSINSLISFLPSLNFSYTVKLIAVVVSFISLANIIRGLLVGRKEIIKISLKEIGIYFLLIIISVFLYFFVWKSYTPYPLHLNWDIYEHITLSNKILEGHLSLLPSEISDTFTFDGYSPMFQILLSIPKAVFNTNLLGIYWWLEYWHYLLTIIASFFLAKRVLQNKWLAFTCVVVAAFVFESTMVYSSLFLIPQTLASLMTAFAIYYLADRSNNKILQLVTIAVIILTHYVVGLLGAAVFLGFYFLIKKSRSKKTLTSLIVLSTLLLIVSLGINYLGNWNLTDREEAKYFNFSLISKINYLSDWYGIGLPIFFLLGYWKIIRNNQVLQKAILIMGLLIVSLVFLPFSYVLKLYTLDRYFINIVVGLGVGTLLLYLPVKLRVIALSWIILFFLVGFYTNQSVYKEFLFFEGFESHLSKNEIEAGVWLSKNAGTKSFLISDPSTQYILEAISGVNTQGGVYMNSGTRQILSEINFLYDPQRVRRYLLSVSDGLEYENISKKRTVFVLSGRYFAWQKFTEDQKRSFFYNTWTPRKIEETGKDYINYLVQSGKFKKIYENDEMAIVEL